MLQVPEHLTVRQLYYLTLVLEHGRVDQAAEAAGVTHQAVHRALTKLNEAVGVELWRSDGGQYQATQRARAFCDWLKPFMQQLPGQIAAVQRGASNRIVFATTQPIMMNYGPHLVRDFLIAHQDCEVILLDKGHSPEAAMLAIKHLEADIAVVPKEMKIPGLKEDLIGTCDYVLAMPGTHPLANRKTLPLSDLAGQPMINYHHALGIRHVIDDIFSRHHPRTVIETGNSEAAMKYALTNNAFTIVPGATVMAHPNEQVRCFSLQALPADLRPPMTVSLFTRAKVTPDPIVAELCKELLARGRAILDDLRLKLQKRCDGQIVA